MTFFGMFLPVKTSLTDHIFVKELLWLCMQVDSNMIINIHSFILNNIGKYALFKYYSTYHAKALCLARPSGTDNIDIFKNKLQPYELPYFMLVIINPDQVRLYPHQSQPLFQYSVPNQANHTLGNVGIIYSGYDLAPNKVLSWKITLSIDYNKNSFEMLLTTLNGTRFFSLSYFVVISAQEVGQYIAISTYCT